MIHTTSHPQHAAFLPDLSKVPKCESVRVTSYSHDPEALVASNGK